MNEKNISLKNYLILAVVLILSIVVVIYFYMWYGAYEENKLNTPIMDKYLSVINYNELDNYLIENKDAVIYVAVLDDENIRLFEKKFKNVIDSNSLNGSILYLNLSSEVKNDKIFNNIKTKYNINNLPCIVVFRNGIVYDVYDIKNNDYSIDKLVSYLMNEGVIDD